MTTVVRHVVSTSTLYVAETVALQPKHTTQYFLKLGVIIIVGTPQRRGVGTAGRGHALPQLCTMSGKGVGDGEVPQGAAFARDEKNTRLLVGVNVLDVFVLCGNLWLGGHVPCFVMHYSSLL